MEKQQILQHENTAFKWRKNSLKERRRMRNDRKKRKRHQRKKENELKADATQGLADRLRNEAKRKERLLYLARKYYLKWLQNKGALRTLQEKAARQPSSSRFGSQAKVKLFFKMYSTELRSNTTLNFVILKSAVCGFVGFVYVSFKNKTQKPGAGKPF